MDWYDCTDKKLLCGVNCIDYAAGFHPRLLDDPAF